MVTLKFNRLEIEDYETDGKLGETKKVWNFFGCCRNFSFSQPFLDSFLIPQQINLHIIYYN